MYKHLKIALGILVLIINTLLYLLIRSPEINKIFYILTNKAGGGLTNPRIRVHGNTNHFSNNNLLIMSNHSHAILDGNIIYNMYYKHNSIETLHTIVKADLWSDPTYKSKIMKLLGFIEHTFMSSWYFIPYKHMDKVDGKKVKNIIVESLSDGKNILIFPEGDIHKNGIPKEFKKGSFEIAVENKLRILPITIKYEKDIGMEKDDPLKILNILLNTFDNVVDIYIHDIIDETDECYEEQNPEGLKDKVFDIIRAPMLV
jgi:1-acyl-sn-glycerol-3-phosphate acyltransferase